jgi:hypothetical protein
MRCPHPDWLDNRLSVAGPREEYEAFRRAAAGAGVAGWWLDYDRLEEDLFHLMMAGPAAGARITAAGARFVARQLRDLAWQDHEAALARIGVDRRCPFDLNALVPVPWQVLRLGEDDPRAIAWLWEHWGTTWPLRRVEVRALPPLRRAALAPGEAGCEIRFWSADWSPWPVLVACRRRWPALRFELAVEYWWGIAEEVAADMRRRRAREARIPARPGAASPRARPSLRDPR